MTYNKDYWQTPVTEAEADMDDAHEKGESRPQKAWICSDRDVWYKNPHYKGKPVPHPETISWDYNSQYCDACDIHFNYDEHCPKCGFSDNRKLSEDVTF